MNTQSPAQVLVECPNTIFCLLVQNETELSKIEIFMNNIRYAEKLSISDMYNWCNRQGIQYVTKFNYRKGQPVWKTLKSFVMYFKKKKQYQIKYEAI